MKKLTVLFAVALCSQAWAGTCEKPNQKELRTLSTPLLYSKCDAADLNIKLLDVSGKNTAYAVGMSTNASTQTYHREKLDENMAQLQTCWATQRAVRDELKRRKVPASQWPAECGS